MTLLLYKDIHLQRVKYIINEQSMNINVFLLFLSFVFLQIERERGYTKFGIRRNSPKGIYLISLMEFHGESFFFYGLIDFMLFLILAWKKWLLHVRDILLSSSTGFGSVCPEPCPTTNLFLFYFRWREGVHTSVLGSQPIIWLLSPSFLCQATRVRLPRINICRFPLCDLHSFLTVILWRLATVNSAKRIEVIIFLSSQGDTTWQYIYIKEQKTYHPDNDLCSKLVGNN